MPRAKSADRPAIHPTAVYDRRDLAEMLGVRTRAVSVAIATGQLRPEKRLGMRRVFLGQWVLDWLNTPDNGTHTEGGPDAEAGR